MDTPNAHVNNYFQTHIVGANADMEGSGDYYQRQIAAGKLRDRRHIPVRAMPALRQTVHNYLGRRYRFREQRRMAQALKPDPTQSNTLGWRAWVWDGQTLRSPHIRTRWETPDLHADDWDDSDALRGVCGIHARLLPRDWRAAGWPENGHQEGQPTGCVVTGYENRRASRNRHPKV